MLEASPPPPASRRESSFRISKFLEYVDGSSSSSGRTQLHAGNDSLAKPRLSVIAEETIDECGASPRVAETRSTQVILNDAALLDDVDPELDRLAFEGQLRRRRARAMAKIGAALRASVAQMRPALLLISALKENLADASPWFSLAKAPENCAEDSSGGGENDGEPEQAKSGSKAPPSRTQQRRRRRKPKSAINALMEEAAGDAGGRGAGVSRPARLPPKRHRTLASAMAIASMPSRLTRHTVSRLSVLRKTTAHAGISRPARLPQRLRTDGPQLHAREDTTSSPGSSCSNSGGSSCSSGGNSGGTNSANDADDVGGSNSGFGLSSLEHGDDGDDGDGGIGRLRPPRRMHSLLSVGRLTVRASAVRASLLRTSLRASLLRTSLRASRHSQLTGASKARPQRSGSRKGKGKGEGEGEGEGKGEEKRAAPEALLLPVLAEEGAALVGAKRPAAGKGARKRATASDRRAQALLLPVLAEEGAALAAGDTFLAAAPAAAAALSAPFLAASPQAIPCISPSSIPATLPKALGPSPALPPPATASATQASPVPMLDLLSA